MMGRLGQLIHFDEPCLSDYLFSERDLMDHFRNCTNEQITEDLTLLISMNRSIVVEPESESIIS